VDPNSGDELTSVLAAITAATEDRDVTAVLQRVVEAACTVANARYGALGVVGEDGTLSQFVHTGLTAAQVEKLGALPRGGGVLGLLLTDPKPVRLTDLSAHPDAGGFPAHHPVMTTFLGTPIRVRGEIFGNLYLTEKRDGTTFTALDEARIVALSARS
jgi:GAF domain-containing protein